MQEIEKHNLSWLAEPKTLGENDQNVGVYYLLLKNLRFLSAQRQLLFFAFDSKRAISIKIFLLYDSAQVTTESTYCRIVLVQVCLKAY